jgi:hypothetical protein
MKNFNLPNQVWHAVCSIIIVIDYVDFKRGVITSTKGVILHLVG